MGDFYTEKMISQKPGWKEKLPLIGLIVLDIFAIVYATFSIAGLLLALIGLSLTVMAFRRLKVEYEYIFINGHLDIDKIINKSKRKNVFSMHVSDLQILAPKGSSALQGLSCTKTLDVTSRREGEPVFEMLVSEKKDTHRILLEPGEELLEGIFLMAPRKVVKTI